MKVQSNCKGVVKFFCKDMEILCWVPQSTMKVIMMILKINLICSDFVIGTYVQGSFKVHNHHNELIIITYMYDCQYCPHFILKIPVNYCEI